MKQKGERRGLARLAGKKEANEKYMRYVRAQKVVDAINKKYPSAKIPQIDSDDRLNGLEYALGKLRENEHYYITQHYWEGKSYGDIAKEQRHSRQYGNAQVARALKHLANPPLSRYIIDGIDGAKKISEATMTVPISLDGFVCVEPDYIEKLSLSQRSYHALKNAGIHTIGQLLLLDIDDLYSIRNIGTASVDEIVDKMGKAYKYYRDVYRDHGSLFERIDKAESLTENDKQMIKAVFSELTKIKTEGAGK